MEFEQLKDAGTLTRTIEALKGRNIEGTMVSNAAEALDIIKTLIPKGASVMNGSSTTLEQIGYIEYLKSGEHGWNNLHEGVLAEKDPAKQAQLRKQAVLSDFYLGSVHALAETGEFVVASNSGSQLPHIVYTSANLIFVVSTKKIVPTLQDAIRRLEEHVVPQEDARMQRKYGIGTALNKVVLFKGESGISGRKVHVILVSENLGF